MKFKMSEKSLFAILLRSPWWISFLIAAILMLLARIFVPSPFLLVALISILPFIILGVIAAWRQRHAPSAEKIDEIRNELSQMTWKQFLPEIEKVFKNQGFNVIRLNSGPADLKLEKLNKITLVSCKRWKASELGVEALRELKNLQSGKDFAYVAFISLNSPSKVGLQFAIDNSIQLIHDIELVSMFLSLRK